MKPLAIRYVRDLAAAREFYRTLGLESAYTERPTRRGVVMWSELAGGGRLALHSLPDEDGSSEHAPVELSFTAEEPLENVVRRLAAAGYQPERGIADETYGRSFTIRDPEGLLIQVNEPDHDVTG